MTQITPDLCLEPLGFGNNSYVRAQGTYRDPGKALAEKDEVMNIYEYTIDYTCGCDEDGMIPGRDVEQVDLYLAYEAKCETHDEGMESYGFSLNEEESVA